MTKTFYIIDGNSLLYRSYYAIPGLSSAKGEPTNAIYGFTNILLKILRTRKIDYISCAFDSPGPTLRHERFPEYKSHRKGMPEDLVCQISSLKELLKAMNIAVFEKEGYEADDIIATLTEKGKEEMCEVFIITGDKDAMQLVGEGVMVLHIGKEEKEIAAKDVKDILGVEPSRVPDLIGLMGDASDGLPGVPGIGPKTASKLISEYGGIEAIYKNLDSMANRGLSDKLKKHRDSCRETRDLAILKRDVPLTIEWDKCKNTGPDNARLIRVFRELGFNSLIRRLLKEDKEIPEPAEDVYKDKNDLKELIEECGKKKEIFIYLDRKKDALILASDKDNIFVLDRPFPKDMLQNSGIKKTGHGFKELVKSLWLEGIDIEGLSFDAEITSYVLNPERPSHDLNGLSLDYFGKGLKEGYKALVETVFSIKEKMSAELKDAGQEQLFYEIEMPLIKILAGMEKEGIMVNQDKLASLSKKLAGEISIKEERIFSIAQERFNLNSSQQVGRILFHKMGLPPQKKTKTGFSTNSEVLETLAPLYPIAYDILSWRELYKIKSTYADGLAELINPKTGRLHTTFNQTVTSTGRLSSSKPNLQNIPIRGDLGRDMREVFEAGKGKLLMSSDYSQIELRILAHLSGDKAMKKAFENDEDIHAATARQVFGLKEDEAAPEMRRRAKIINFGIIYGISSYGLGRELGIAPEEAQEYIEQYMARFPSVRDYIEFLIEEAKKNGFAKTILGRRRPLAGADIERMAINTPIQGSSADIIKLAMVRIDLEFREEDLKSAMLLQVHDELLFEVPQKELDRTGKTVKSIMENVFSLSIPLKVNISQGKTWADIE